MSESPRGTPASPPMSATCTVCGDVFPVMVCQSNRNGNLGRLFARCPRINEEGAPACGFFRWKSPSPSPSLSPTSVLPPALTLPPATTAPRVTISCRKKGCSSSRIHPLCTRSMCRRHCVEQGGCPAKRPWCTSCWAKQQHPSATLHSSTPSTPLSHF